MIQRERSKSDEWREAGKVLISRRAAIGSSVAIVVGAMSARSFGQEGGFSGLPKEIQERMAKSREFSTRMREAATDEERNQIMAERNAWEQARAIEGIKKQLEVSDQEWLVVKPRVEAVYNRVHPASRSAGPNTQPTHAVERSRNELGRLLSNKEAKAEEIKAKLTAFRSAKEQERQELVKARASLRQLMTLRQEAVLVLSGLLD
jgi:chromosome segregation ATPase